MIPTHATIAAGRAELMQIQAEVSALAARARALADRLTGDSETAAGAVDDEALARAVCDRLVLHLDALRGPGRSRQAVEQRSLLIAELTRAGLGPVRIGRLLHRHHGAICHSLRHAARSTS
jgi:chromosomal replication initiation ATPase DnaA